MSVLGLCSVAGFGFSGVKSVASASVSVLGYV
jgi:hypothetical protein